jgi:hypothetical protein
MAILFCEVQLWSKLTNLFLSPILPTSLILVWILIWMEVPPLVSTGPMRKNSPRGVSHYLLSPAPLIYWIRLTISSGTDNKDPLNAAHVPPSVLRESLGDPVITHDNPEHNHQGRHGSLTHQEAQFRG